MSRKALLTLALCAGFALPAAAQQPPAAAPASGPAAGQQPPAPNGQDGPTIQARLTQDLDKAGFTNVQVMPESFLVRAKDKEGRPVIMVVNPDSITSFTALNQPANGQPGASTPAPASPAKK